MSKPPTSTVYQRKSGSQRGFRKSRDATPPNRLQRALAVRLPSGSHLGREWSMRAAVLHQVASLHRNPLVIEDLPLPSPGPGEVQLRVEACGVCRTDLHIVTGELPMKRPMSVPGHQVVGRVAALGVDLSPDSVRVGQRVGVSWLGGADGTCEACRHGLENLCDNI